jgi:hypothetical protein
LAVGPGLAATVTAIAAVAIATATPAAAMAAVFAWLVRLAALRTTALGGLVVTRAVQVLLASATTTMMAAAMAIFAIAPGFVGRNRPIGCGFVTATKEAF